MYTGTLKPMSLPDSQAYKMETVQSTLISALVLRPLSARLFGSYCVMLSFNCLFWPGHSSHDASGGGHNGTAAPSIDWLFAQRELSSNGEVDVTGLLSSSKTSFHATMISSNTTRQPAVQGDIPVLERGDTELEGTTERRRGADNGRSTSIADEHLSAIGLDRAIADNTTYNCFSDDIAATITPAKPNSITASDDVKVTTGAGVALVEFAGLKIKAQPIEDAAKQVCSASCSCPSTVTTPDGVFRSTKYATTSEIMDKPRAVQQDMCVSGPTGFAEDVVSTLTANVCEDQPDERSEASAEGHVSDIGSDDNGVSQATSALRETLRTSAAIPMQDAIPPSKTGVPQRMPTTETNAVPHEETTMLQARVLEEEGRVQHPTRSGNVADLTPQTSITPQSSTECRVVARWQATPRNAEAEIQTWRQQPPSAPHTPRPEQKSASDMSVPQDEATAVLHRGSDREPMKKQDNIFFHELRRAREAWKGAEGELTRSQEERDELRAVLRSVRVPTPPMVMAYFR